MSRFQFVADNSATFEVKRLCDLVEIERSSSAWLRAAPARQERARADGELAARIRAVHAQDNTQGATRITAELNDSAPADDFFTVTALRWLIVNSIPRSFRRRLLHEATTLPTRTGKTHLRQRPPPRGGLR